MLADPYAQQNPNQPPNQPQGGPTQIALNQQQLTELQTMVQNPLFTQFRQQIIQNPNTLPQLLQYVGQNYPNIFQLLTAHPQLLMHLIQYGQVPIQGVPGGQLGGQAQPGQPPAPGGAQPPMPAPPAQPTIELTEQDRANVVMIMEMGFSEAQAIEAYLVCNKNVELAINYLFDSQN